MIKTNEKGFTLIELLIVVAIIAILAAIAIPQFSKYKARGYKATLTSDMKNAYTAAQAYLSDNIDGTVADLATLQAYGYQQSPGMDFDSANVTGAGAGNIELWHATLKSSGAANIGVVDADGLIVFK